MSKQVLVIVRDTFVCFLVGRPHPSSAKAAVGSVPTVFANCSTVTSAISSLSNFVCRFVIRYLRRLLFREPRLASSHEELRSPFFVIFNIHELIHACSARSSMVITLICQYVGSCLSMPRPSRSCAARWSQVPLQTRSPWSAEHPCSGASCDVLIKPSIPAISSRGT